MANNFFDEESQENDEQPSVQKVKIGEKEYSQDELTALVGLGETAQQYEKQWDRKISEFYPDYTKKSQELSELKRSEEERRKEAEEAEKAALASKAQEGSLSPEEAQKLAVEEAKKLGLITKDDFSTEVQKAVADAIAGKQLMDDAQVAINEAKERYGVETKLEDVLRHMDSEGFKKPEKAIKDMFESQIDKWKEEQIKGIKPSGMVTQEASTAGGKKPPEPRQITRDNLAKAIQESLTRGGRG